MDVQSRASQDTANLESSSESTNVFQRTSLPEGESLFSAKSAIGMLYIILVGMLGIKLHQ
jgi:hypothetical protein